MMMIFPLFLLLIWKMLFVEWFNKFQLDVRG